MYSMITLWFESALLPSGWARRVRVTSSAGRIERVSADTQHRSRVRRSAQSLSF